MSLGKHVQAKNICLPACTRCETKCVGVKPASKVETFKTKYRIYNEDIPFTALEQAVNHAN